MGNNLLNVKEVAAQLGVSVPTVWRRAHDGDFPKPLKFGHASRWPQSDVDAAIEKLRNERDGEAA